MLRSVRIRNGTLIALGLVLVPAASIYLVETIGRPKTSAVASFRPEHDVAAELSSAPSAKPDDAPSTAAAEPVRPPRTPPSIVRSPDPGRSPLADKLNAPTGDIRADLAILARVFDNFRTELGANPYGNNREITAQLSGRNAHRHAPLPRDHPAINTAGELLDRWGTAFFFHALSARQMEIRSAGPDREIYSGDDIVWSPLPPPKAPPGKTGD